MGAAAFPLILLGTAAFETVGTIESADAQQAALESREEQNNIAAAQRRIKEDDQIERVLSTQRAIAVTTPFKTTSATFGVISQESLNQFAEDREATNLNLKFENEAIDQKIDNVERMKFIGIADNIFEAARIYAGMKTGEGKSSESGRIETNTDPRRFEEF
jgi:hypothetical protein